MSETGVVRLCSNVNYPCEASASGADFAWRFGSSIAPESQGSILFDLLRLDVVQLRAQLITSVSGCIQKPFQEFLLPRVKLSEF